MSADLSKTAKKKFIVEAVITASAALGNTPAVCRKSYIHSAILAHAEQGNLPALMRMLDNAQFRRSGLMKNEIRLCLFKTARRLQSPALRKRLPHSLAFTAMSSQHYWQCLLIFRTVVRCSFLLCDNEQQLVMPFLMLHDSRQIAQV